MPLWIDATVVGGGAAVLIDVLMWVLCLMAPEGDEYDDD